MRFRSILMLAAVTSLAFLPAAQAEHHESKGKGKGHAKTADESKKAMQDVGGSAEQAIAEGQAQVEEAGAQVEDAGAEAEGQVEDARQQAVERVDEATAEATGRGDEMRARRDERKAIMAESKENAEPGTPQKGKKPWWRFWESDEAE